MILGWSHRSECRRHRSAEAAAVFLAAAAAPFATGLTNPRRLLVLPHRRRNPPLQRTAGNKARRSDCLPKEVGRTERQRASQQRGKAYARRDPGRPRSLEPDTTNCPGLRGILVARLICNQSVVKR
jgi:hypothetical protein